LRGFLLEGSRVCGSGLGMSFSCSALRLACNLV
jgi:hypothetical protein